MKISNSLKIIIGFFTILLIGLIASVYHIDINGFISKFNDKLNNDNRNSKKINVQLSKCIDGNTAQFKESGKVYNYRFLGINTQGSNYRKQADSFVCNKLSNAKKIYIQYETQSVHKTKDNYKLVWVFVDGKLLQEQLILNGLSKIQFVYTKLSYLDNLYNSLDSAKKRKINIYKNYNNKVYDEYYTVIYDNPDNKFEVNIKKGDIATIPANPQRDGYIFVGWMSDNELYDLSKPIYSNLILTPKFAKNT